MHHENGQAASAGTSPPKSKTGPHAPHVNPAASRPISTAIVAGHHQDEKRFATLAARYALSGNSLIRTERNDGPVIFYATRWGFSRALRDLAEAEAFLLQIGGR